MRRSRFSAAALLLALLGPVGPAQALAAAPETESGAIDEAAERRAIEDAYQLVAQKKPAEAIQLLDRLIAVRERTHAGEKRQIFNARSETEALVYMGLAAKNKREALVQGENWSLAIFLKGFALVDLGRTEEAKMMFDRALAMAPMNAHYLGEVAEWHKNRKDWPTAYGVFKQALEASDFSPDEAKNFDKRRALRGLGFVLIEQGKLDDAEALFRQCLAMDPNDAGAKSELQYIKEQREKAAPGRS
jgi:tetratricopeptide (TPR) repeat protein